MDTIAIYIPNYNGADYLRKVKIPIECDCIVMDNHSTDDSIAVCRQRGFICVENDMLVSRTENWLRCINHFRAQNYKWMKWLFTGDELSDNAYDIMNEAVNNADSAAVILFDYYINTGKRKTLKSWNNHFKAGFVNAGNARLSCIEKGSFAAPICLMLSQNCTFNNINIDGYSWAADVLLLDQLIGENRIFYCNKTVGVFNSQLRMTYSANKRKLASYLESTYVIYGIYREYRHQNPEDNVKGTWFQHHMIACLTDNINSFSDFLYMFYALMKGLGKFVLKKNGGNLEL